MPLPKSPSPNKTIKIIDHDNCNGIKLKQLRTNRIKQSAAQSKKRKQIHIFTGCIPSEQMDRAVFCNDVVSKEMEKTLRYLK